MKKINMALNSTQENLIQEFCEDRIIPSIAEVLRLCKIEESKKVCVYLMLRAIKGTLDREAYEALLIKHIGQANQLWLRKRFTNLHQLFQADNLSHVFVASVIDPRFYTGSAANLGEWQNSCKLSISEFYTKEILKEIKSSTLDAYNYAIALIQSEDQEAQQNHIQVQNSLA